jgi:RNA polymerase sigma factor (sigma-70 family)
VQLRATIPNSKSHEEFFLGHYDWLVKWALQLSHGQHEQATDLVHDLYVQLVRSHPNIDFEDEDRARGYLYTMLRHLSVSKARREGRDALSSLLIVDYESVEYGLRCVDRSKLILIRSDLARVCEYACIRRHTSRSASVLILRFFFGYYPSEIVRVLQTTPEAVEKHLQAARQEARAYLERPGTLRFLGQDVTPTQKFSPYLPDEPSALFAELRTRIFMGTGLTCVSSGAIEMRYAENGLPMGVPELAHVVSCAHCLEMTNSVLGLPTLAERFPPDTVDRDQGGPGPAGSHPNSAKLKKGIRQTYEHRPKKLQIAVDGEVLAAQRISSARSELQVKLEPLAKPAFIEVFSEQGLRLAYLQLDEAMMIDLQPIATSAELSDGRHLEVKLTFPGGIPVVKLSYYDPLLDESTNRASAPARPMGETSNTPARSMLRRIKDAIERVLRPWFTSFESPWPLGVTMAAAILALAFSFSFLMKKTTPAQPTLPTARTLLAKSRDFEQASIGGGGAIHSAFALETLSEQGTIVESHTVDSWRSVAPSRSAIRLLDTKGRVVGGEWKDPKGRVTRYPKRSPEALDGTGRPPAGFDDTWRAVAQAVSNSWLNQVDQRVCVSQQSDGFDLHYESASEDSSPSLVKADLVLRADSAELVRGTYTIREATYTHEYRFRTLTYEVIPPSRVQDSDFAPDHTLVSLRSGLSLAPEASEDNTHLTLKAFQLLSNLGPGAENYLNLDRSPDGTIRLSGVLPTPEEKASITHIFRSLHGEGRLRLVLHSGDEASQSASTHRKITVESLAPISMDTEHVPLHGELQTTLSVQGLSGQELEARINQVASNALTRAARMHREAWIIYQIAANDFSLHEMRLMEPEDKMLWLTLLDSHVRSLDQELVSLTADLAPLFHTEKARSPVTATTIPSPENVAELRTVAQALNRTGEHLDHLLTADLTLSPSSLPANHNVSELAESLADLGTQESLLHQAVGRLQMLGQAQGTK